MKLSESFSFDSVETIDLDGSSEIRNYGFGERPE